MCSARRRFAELFRCGGAVLARRPSQVTGGADHTLKCPILTAGVHDLVRWAGAVVCCGVLWCTVQSEWVLLGAVIVNGDGSQAETLLAGPSGGEAEGAASDVPPSALAIFRSLVWLKWFIFFFFMFYFFHSFVSMHALSNELLGSAIGQHDRAISTGSG